MLSIDQATQQIQGKTRPLELERVSISDAAARYLATDAIARRSLPPYDNSAMDGFAVRTAELPATLPVSGDIPAGATPDATLPAGAVMRIMTGAPLPGGADGVVMREDVDDRGDSAVFSEPARVGQHIRKRGEDIAAGEIAVPAGSRLCPGEIGMLAAQGFAEVEVRRRPTVAIIGTGDELVDVDQEPGPGRIVNSNAYALAAQVSECGGEPVNLGIVADTRSALIERLRQGVQHDVLLSSGGVSVGDYDYVKEALAEAGVEIVFWKVAVKPGKPLVFGVADSGALVFGLPGNPVSSMVTFELFVRPALLALQGAARIHRPRARVTLTAPYRKKPGRTHFVRAVLERSGDHLEASPHSKQGSGMLSSMVGIDALVEVDRDLGDVDAGTVLPALLLGWP
jgi:molybdopterin molybdotransferase